MNPLDVSLDLSQNRSGTTFILILARWNHLDSEDPRAPEKSKLGAAIAYSNIEE